MAAIGGTRQRGAGQVDKVTKCEREPLRHGHAMRQLFTVLGSDRWVLNQVSIVEDAATRDRPARGEQRDHATVETMMEL